MRKPLWHLVLSVAIIVTLAGCSSVTKIDPTTCPETIKWKTAPPRTEWVLPPAVSVPPEPKANFLTWTKEQIEADPSGYLEVLYSDVVNLYLYGVATYDYLGNLERARARAVAESEATDGDTE